MALPCYPLAQIHLHPHCTNAETDAVPRTSVRRNARKSPSRRLRCVSSLSLTPDLTAGYSVLEERHLLSHGNYTVVTGSPRDESKGSVTLGRKDSITITPVLLIPGKQVGSYFGSSLAAVDLNNDGWNDLIVGAPFYFDRSKEQGGAVYVYMNENGWFQKEPSVVLTGPIRSAFGIASGKVYIWMGSTEQISEKYSQVTNAAVQRPTVPTPRFSFRFSCDVIAGKSVGDGKFKTFGYSLNGGIDMDDNSYPDLLVGSLDDRVALLRARPVIQLSYDLSVQPKTVDPKCSPDGKACIRAKVCFSYTLSNGKNDFKKNVLVRYTVEADIDRWRKPRVYFRSSGNASHSSTVSLTSPDQKCHKLELNVA
ncbi:hypothetical protein CRUP_019979, partial [Coryphaenoides rupestris]